MGVFKDIQTDLEQASVRLVTEYRDRLQAEAFRLCGNRADAEDLVGSVFKEVFAHNGGYNPEKGELYSYLSGILSHIYARSKRRAVNRGTVPVDPSVMAEDESLATTCTDDEIFARSDHDALRAAIQRLPSDYRDAVLLHYFSELPIVKVARILGVSGGTVKWRLSMARKALAEDLDKGLSGLKKPLALLAAALLGVGALFGAWVSPLGDWVAEKVFGSSPAAETVQDEEPAPDIDLPSDIEGPDDNELQDNGVEPAGEEGVVSTPAPQADTNVISETQKQEGEDNMNISAKIKKTVATASVTALTLTSAVLPTASAAEEAGVSYTLLEWIRTTPSRGFAQYIDTGVYPDVGIETHFVFKREENCPEQRFFGVQYWGNVNGQVYYSFNFGPNWGAACLGMMYFRREVFGSRQSFSGLNVKEKTTIDFSDKLFLNGVCVWTNTFENVDFSGSQHAHLRIGQDVNDTSTQMTVYECRISKDGVDLCDLWPCKKVDASGNEWYGVYDFANQKFIGNSAAPNDVTKTYVGGPVDEKFKIKYRKPSGRYDRVPFQKGFSLLIF